MTREQLQLQLQCEEQYAECVANWHSKDAIAYFNQILLSCRSN